MCAARGGVRAHWACTPSMPRQLAQPVRVGFAQIVGSVHLRQPLQQPPRPRFGPAERPGRSPRVPATASEAERRAAVAMAATNRRRAQPSAKFCAMHSVSCTHEAMMHSVWRMARCRWLQALHPTLLMSWPRCGEIGLVGWRPGSWTLRLQRGTPKPVTHFVTLLHIS